MDLRPLRRHRDFRSLYAAQFVSLLGTMVIFRMTLWNQTIPDSFRGRLAGIEMVSYMSGPLLGNVEAGMIAVAFNVKVSVVSGGVLCVVGVLLCAGLLPRPGEAVEVILRLPVILASVYDGCILLGGCHGRG